MGVHSETITKDNLVANRVHVMGFPALSIGRIQFEFTGCWVVIYNFSQILKVHSVREQCKPDRTSRFVASATSDMVLNCLPSSHKMDTKYLSNPR